MSNHHAQKTDYESDLLVGMQSHITCEKSLATLDEGKQLLREPGYDTAVRKEGLETGFQLRHLLNGLNLSKLHILSKPQFAKLQNENNP